MAGQKKSQQKTGEKVYHRDPEYDRPRLQALRRHVTDLNREGRILLEATTIILDVVRSKELEAERTTKVADELRDLMRTGKPGLE